ncbi:hypothetical protein CR513_12555, partial [Mucuna pruriens]
MAQALDRYVKDPVMLSAFYRDFFVKECKFSLFSELVEASTGFSLLRLFGCVDPPAPCYAPNPGDIGYVELCIIASMSRKRSSGSLHPFDPEIKKTLNRIRKSKNMHVGHASDNFSSVTKTDNFEMKPGFSDNPLYEPDPMKNNNNRTLKELATPDYPQLESTHTYELKFGLIHMLLKFHSLASEVPRKHLKEFHVYFYEGLLMMDRSMIDAASGEIPNG